MSKYTTSDIERADGLYDHMPLSKVSDVTGIPESTLGYWNDKGWIDSDVDWRGKNGGRSKKGSVNRAVVLVHEREMSQKDAAKVMGIDPSRVSRYLKEYRNQ